MRDTDEFTTHTTWTQSAPAHVAPHTGGVEALQEHARTTTEAPSQLRETEHITQRVKSHVDAGADTSKASALGKRTAESSDAPQKRTDALRRARHASADTQRPVSLATWLTTHGKSANPEQMPWPATCDDAIIQDRQSLIIGYAYPLTSASPTRISAMLDHLTHVVHPQIPESLFPAPFSRVAPKHRSSTHDMYAFRVMQLKPGRSGLHGPSDFGTEQGQDDDGETWGSEKIMRVIRDMGASDVLVIVSRCVANS